MKVYDAEGLARENGRDGGRTLVAVQGNVYDLSESTKWVAGRHMNRHDAGCDLTAAIEAAPHGPEVLDEFQTVGEYEEAPEQPAEGLRGKVDVWLGRHPFFRRHPHPAIVHMPVGIIVAAAVFEVTAILSGSARMEWAAFCCLILVLLSLLPTIASGYFTWWINYDARSHPVINTKRRLAWVSLALAAGSVALRAITVDTLAITDLQVVIYVVAVFALTAILSINGYLGGNLTFPYK
ncbi:MAG: cytochrome b5 domain-containing protein [Deltaproteobacteria bacterium]